MSVLKQHVEQRVSSFVPRRKTLIFVGHRHAAPFAAHADFDSRLFQLGHADGFFVQARRLQGSLIEEIGKICAGKTGRAASGDRQIDHWIEFHVAGMHLKNGLATAHVGQVHRDLSVKTTRSEQRGVEHIRPIGCRDNNNPILRVETVHLNEQRIERLFAFVVSTAPAMSATASDSVNFVNKNEARCVFAGLFKHVTNTAGADTNEHFHEIRTADAEESGVSFAGNCLGEQRLACAWSADHEYALGNASAQTLKFLGIAQELDQFGDLVLGFLNARHIFERNLVLVFAEHAGLALAEAQRAFASILNLANQKKVDQPKNQEERQQVQEKIEHHVIGLGIFELAGLDELGLDLIGQSRLQLERYLAWLSILAFEAFTPFIGLVHSTTDPFDFRLWRIGDDASVWNHQIFFNDHFQLRVAGQNLDFRLTFCNELRNRDKERYENDPDQNSL